MTPVAADRESLPEREFGRAVADLHPKLTTFCRYLTKHPEAGEDLAQDVVMKALSVREQFKAGTNLKAWLFMIARNRFLTDRRRAWRVVEMAEGQAEQIRCSSDQHAVLEAKDAMTAIGYLPSEQADAVIAAGEGLTIEEMATEFGIAEGTAKSRVSRARMALHRYFGE